MILVTVGTQLGFDRLIEGMDQIALALKEPIIAQIGGGSFIPQNMEYHRNIAAPEFEELVGRARLIVAHAGIGSVLTARRMNRPIVLIPRRASLGEHRNDHQIATAKQLNSLDEIYIVQSTLELQSVIEKIPTSIATRSQASSDARKLRQAIKGFINFGHI